MSECPNCGQRQVLPYKNGWLKKRMSVLRITVAGLALALIYSTAATALPLKAILHERPPIHLPKDFESKRPGPDVDTEYRGYSREEEKTRPDGRGAICRDRDERDRCQER
jgi:hypothetical protein